MTKKTTSAFITNLHRGTFFIVLLLLVIHALPRALGEGRQQTISQRSLHAPSKVDGATWTITGSLNTARFLHTATLLPSGVVLVAGGLACLHFANGNHSRSTAPVTIVAETKQQETPGRVKPPLVRRRPAVTLLQPELRMIRRPAITPST